MTSVVRTARLRLIALNPANAAGNEVEGTATGGMEKVAAAEGKKVFGFRSVSIGQKEAKPAHVSRELQHAITWTTRL